MPGTSVRDAVALVAGEMTEGDGVPHLPELPARGPGSDLVGRTAGLLASVAPDLAVETTPVGWRFADAPGRESRRARWWLGEDLDAWEEALEGYDGPSPSPSAGPWTTAASVELRTGERAVRDPGACRDLAEALSLAALEHVADLRRRLPRAQVSLWLDEPALPAVLHGLIPTQSGLGRYAAVDEPVVDRASAHRRAVAGRGCRSRRALLRAASAVRPVPSRRGRRGVGRPPADDRRDDDPVGELLESGVRLLPGWCPRPTSSPAPRCRRCALASHSCETSEPPRSRAGGHRRPGRWSSPTCGLAGASVEHVRIALSAVRAAGRGLREGEGPAWRRVRAAADPPRGGASSQTRSTSTGAATTSRLRRRVSDAEYDKLMRELEALEAGASRAASARLADAEGRWRALSGLRARSSTSSGC